MRQTALDRLSTEELIKAFEDVCLDQSKAMRQMNNRRYNALYDKVMSIREALNRRAERGLLSSLYLHADCHVRFQASMATLAIFPDAARDVLVRIADRNEWPSYVDAKRVLGSLEQGTFTPR